MVTLRFFCVWDWSNQSKSCHHSSPFFSLLTNYISTKTDLPISKQSFLSRLSSWNQNSIPSHSLTSHFPTFENLAEHSNPHSSFSHRDSHRGLPHFWCLTHSVRLGVGALIIWVQPQKNSICASQPDVWGKWRFRFGSEDGWDWEVQLSSIVPADVQNLLPQPGECQNVKRSKVVWLNGARDVLNDTKLGNGGLGCGKLIELFNFITEFGVMGFD